jgi:serine/threonine-protein kinase
VDHHGVVQASTDSHLIGKMFAPAAPMTQVQGGSSDLTVYSAHMGQGRDAFVFKTPILFQHTKIGTVFLGVSQAGMQSVLSAMFWLMLALGTITVSSVVALSWFFGLLILRPVRLLTRTLLDFGDGDLDRRISEKRSDEIGQIYAAFNSMADKIQTQLTAVRPVHLDHPKVFAPEFAPSLDSTIISGQ